MERIKKYEPLWGKWTVKRIIGEGSFGAVYEVESEKFGNRSSCAVKLISFKNAEMLQGLSDGETLSSEELEQLKIEEARKNVREAVLMEKLQGRDHIVTIYDYDIFPGETTTDVIIRMELLTNLNNYMKQHTTDSESDLKSTVIKLGIDIGKALEDCEEEKIVHRDIKPDNIFVNKNRTFKLGDFGLSRKMNKSASFSLRKSAGTPLYMAPETFGWGNKTDYQSDIYSLGIVMYQLLNDGNIPFVSDMRDFIEVDNAIGRRLDREKILPPKYEDGELWKVLQKACEFEKKDRYQEAREFRKALEKLKNEIRVEQKQEHGVEKNESVKEEKQKLDKEVKKKQDESKLEKEKIYNNDLKVEPNIEKQYNVGESIWFGTYPQEADGTKKPIEWIILETKENRMLLLSKYILDTRKYHEKKKGVTWEESDIRQWLNNEFYMNAFNSVEQKAIWESITKTNNNFKYGTNGGNDTADKVFLLSVEDAIKRFPNDEGRKAKATEYAQKVGGTVINKKIGDSWWWLRSPGKYGYRAAEIFDSGWIDASGESVNSKSKGVRPAIWVQKNSIKFIKREKIEKKVASEQEEVHDPFVKKEKASSDFSKKDIGSTLLFGRYPQTESGDKKPIEWIVVKREGNKALLLSKYVLDAKPYNKEDKAVTWETSDLRRWLNNDFYVVAFNLLQRKKISNILLKTEDNYIDGTNGGKDTTDKVFLLSRDEVEKLLNNENRVAKATQYAEKAGYSYDYEYKFPSVWWLRSPGMLQNSSDGVSKSGYIEDATVATKHNGVRPAIWIDI